MIRFKWCMRACGVFLLWAGTAVALPAQIFTTLHSFDQTDGANPEAALVQATNGDFYGTTYYGGGGCGGCGTVFKITPDGRFTTLHSFDITDGAGPEAGLVQGTDGNFYGTTSGGGPYGFGTIFKITPSGTLTTLHSFDCTDGCYPDAPLVQDNDGNFYGTAAGGGANGGAGTVFKITPSGQLTTEYSFCSQTDCADGAVPGSLIRAANADFYGTTVYSGNRRGCRPSGCGTIFKITPSGTLTTLHRFNNRDGAFPVAGLVQGTDGDFYGTTEIGGANNDGTVFKITSRGKLTTLHSFDGTDGVSPLASLIQATDGNFYGTTYNGGANGRDGTVFKITAKGTLTTIYRFCALSCPSGWAPDAALVQGTDGKLYGTTAFGGNYNQSRACQYGCGTIFRLSVALK